MTNFGAQQDQQNEAEGNTSEPSTAQCAAKLMETIPIIMQFIRSEIRSKSDTPLSLQQFRVLAFLSRHAGASLSDVANHLGITRATASTMTDRLVKQGYIHRADNQQERRHLHLTLTESGNHHLQIMREAIGHKIANLFTELTPAELSGILHGLNLLHHTFGHRLDS